MSRIPPNLLYLTIYNPTLQPLGPVPDDDEDAEEQAHILFYTAKERAVSRDRMLRQVGLAKALVNFSDMFNSADICNNVHSQSKRLIMVSPEPDFWIHAGVEVAKMPRAPPDKDKAKSKDRSKSNEKGKGKATETIPLYDYQEGSVHDLALRADILRGYEQFKLTHGSFTSILSEIGKEGLELQLERFFTVWAWSWNLEDGAEFGEHLGIPLHPSFPLLRSTLDNYTQRLPNRTSLLLIKPPYVVPSPQYSTAKHPTSLIRHLLSLIPPTPPVSEVASRDGTIKGRQPSDGEAPNGKDPPTTGSFLGIPAVNMNVKWGWPAALTFGKGPSKRPALESNLGADENKEAGPVNNHSDASSPSKEITELDQHTLKDAISTDASSIASEANEDPPTQITDADQTQALMPELDATDELDTAPDTIKHPQIHQNRMPADVDPATSRSEATTGEEHTTATLPLPVFSSINVHLASSDNPLLTHRQKVYYITVSYLGNQNSLIGV
ncbi:hypothetical protein H0H87_000855 [Tephrocybe sp. NHM501043]|nr:hypothetical protein H0H87_000855 [Tephrocybe sp. NHM501043]